MDWKKSSCRSPALANVKSDPVLPAGFYLLRRSAFNRVRRVLGRLRQPRYALALLVGFGYVGLLFFGQRAQSDAPVAIPAMQWTGTLLLALLAIKWWLFGADRIALAFTPAEIQFLFPAPVSRAGLLGFKLMRAQFMILLNVIIWLALLNRGRATQLPIVLHGLTLWAMFTTMFLHRVGVALTRDSLLEHGKAGITRNWPALVGVTAISVVIFLSFTRALPQGLSEYPGGVSEGLRLVVETPPLSWALIPFRIPFLPLSAATVVDWIPLFLSALAVVALHLVWVIRADKAFEEAALEASARRAEILDRWRKQGGKPRAPARRNWRWGRLAPSGHPMRAIVWKNLTKLIRTGSPGVVAATSLLLAAIVAFTVVAGDEHLEVTVMIATLALGWMGFLSIFGPQWVRNDLRGELDHLQVLRTWPVSGLHLMAAQVFSSALALTLTQGALAIVGLTALASTPQFEVAPRMLVALFVPGLLVLTTLNLVALSIQNAGALLYPSWVRTEIRPAGIEAMGQHLLTAGISLLLLMVTSIGPVAVGGGLVYFLWDSLTWWSLLPAFLIAACAYGLEAFLLLDWMGDRFERLDLSPVE